MLHTVFLRCVTVQGRYQHFVECAAYIWLRPWRWKQQILRKRCCISVTLHSNTAQKTVIFKMFAYTDVNLEHFSWDPVFVLMSVHLRNRIGKLFFILDQRILQVACFWSCEPCKIQWVFQMTLYTFISVLC